MPSRDADDSDEEQQFEGEQEDDYGNEMEENEEVAGSSRKRSHRRSAFIDDVADEDDDEDEDEEDEDEEDEYLNPRKKKMRRASAFIDDTADVASDDEDEEEGEEEEDDFINDTDAQVDERGTGLRRHSRVEIQEKEEDEEDLEDLERHIHERYAARREQEEYGDEEIGQVEQQANLPSVTDTKLWMVKCAQGFEREAACCLMQKYLDLMAQGIDLQIMSAVALDHLKGYLYIEAHKDAYVRQACKGMRNIYAQTVKLVPIKEMTDVLTVQVKQMGLGHETWVRVKSGVYKGDIARVIEFDNLRQRVTLKLVPRIDFQAMKKRMEGGDSNEEKKKASKIVPPARFVNLRQIKDMGIVVERKRDSVTGDMFETVNNMLFKDGYLYKTMSIKSVNSQNIKPSFDELQKFQSSNSNAESDMTAAVGGSKKQRHFRKGDMVVVMSGDLKNLKGCVEKVDDENIHVRTKMEGIEGTVLSFHQNELCKFFETGDHVKVVSGTHEGTTGMIVKLERNNVLIIIADRTNEDIKVFADNVVECKEEASGVTKLGDYQLYDFVQLDRNSFGIIVSVENDGFQILKANPERREVVGVKLREIGRKIFDRNFKAYDQYRNSVGLKDLMKILEGPFKGKQGPIEHINRGIVFIRDARCPENGGFICARAASCVAVGGMHNQTQSVDTNTITAFRSSGVPQYGNRLRQGKYGGRGRERQDHLVGKTVKIRFGGYKGYRGRVLGVEGHNVRIELESQMKVVAVSRDYLTEPFTDSANATHANETPMHRLQTPMRPYMTPSRNSSFDPLATPVRDGMRTPVIDRAWNVNDVGTPNRDYN